MGQEARGQGGLWREGPTWGPVGTRRQLGEVSLGPRQWADTYCCQSAQPLHLLGEGQQKSMSVPRDSLEIEPGAAGQPQRSWRPGVAWAGRWGRLCLWCLPREASRCLKPSALLLIDGPGTSSLHPARFALLGRA